MTGSQWVMNDPADPTDVEGPATGEDLRRAQSAGFAGGAAFEPFPGVVGTEAFPVSVDAGDGWTVGAGAGVLPGVTAGGPYLAGVPASAGALAVRDSTNSRADRVVLRQYDELARKEVVVEVLAGAPSPGTPVMPALPSRSVHLAELTVPPVGGGNTTVDTSGRLYACGLGGVLLAGNSSLLPATASTYQRARLLDTGDEVYWTGAAWEPVVDDTGWVTMPAPQDHFTNDSGHPVRIRRIGKHVEIFGRIKRGDEFSLLANNTLVDLWEFTGALAEFAPSRVVPGVFSADNANVFLRGRFWPTVVQVANMGQVNLPPGAFVNISGSWFLD